MKTETRIYDDGTEPDVIRRFCCDGLCKQGRECPVAPPPAEAATEIGADDGLETVGGVALLAVVIVLTIAAISILAGYFS